MKCIFTIISNPSPRGQIKREEKGLRHVGCSPRTTAITVHDAYVLSFAPLVENVYEMDISGLETMNTRSFRVKYQPLPVFE